MPPVIVEKILGSVLSTLFTCKQEELIYAKTSKIPESLKVTSTAFGNNEVIPWKHGGTWCNTKEAQNTSPQLQVENLPEETRSLMVIMEDLDPPTPKPIVHMIAYNLAYPGKTDFPEGFFDSDEAKSKNATFGGDRVGYQGPGALVNHGPHRYYFEVYALKEMTSSPLAPKLKKEEVIDLLSQYGVAKGVLVGTFERTDSKN